MKLRNKKTGEIGKLSVYTDGHVSVDDVSSPWCENTIKSYDSLAELNKEWTDYEEPKGWCVTMYGGISRITKDDENLIPDLKEIGNYFNDKESAYDALDKLKAWKRLKDKGFEFTEWYKPDGCEPFIVVETNIDYDDVDNMELQKDLDLLFGGEE